MLLCWKPMLPKGFRAYVGGISGKTDRYQNRKGGGGGGVTDSSLELSEWMKTYTRSLVELRTLLR